MYTRQRPYCNCCALHIAKIAGDAVMVGDNVARGNGVITGDNVGLCGRIDTDGNGCETKKTQPKNYTNKRGYVMGAGDQIKLTGAQPTLMETISKAKHQQQQNNEHGRQPRDIQPIKIHQSRKQPNTTNNQKYTRERP